jgi:hypothetical protein
MGEVRNVFNILFGKPEAKRQLGRPRRKLEDDIRMDLMEIRRKVLTGFIWLRRGDNVRLF